jgi:predicted RNA-binding protein with TRAM domain
LDAKVKEKTMAKKSTVIFGIFIVLAIVGLVFTACGNETTSNENTSNTTPQSVAKPTATPAGGIYTTVQTVTLATATSGANIYYTLDGTNPTTSSTKYITPISISTSTTLKAIAVKTGMANSEMLNETYTINNNLPITLPTTGVTELTLNTWEDGTIAVGGEQWFKFTATASTQYIHFETVTLNSGYVQLYDNNGSTVGSQAAILLSNTLSLSRTVKSGDEYYINVTPITSSSSGAYRIAYNESTTPPPSVILPTTDVTELTASTWENGTIARDGEQWFKFTATASTQYIHFENGTLSSVYVQLYDNNGSTVGRREILLSSTLSLSRTVTSGDEFYIKVTPFLSSGSGAYRIAFNSSTTTPPLFVGLPTTGVTELTANTWENGTIASGGEQWFKFTATASTQYIHFEDGSMRSVNVELYDRVGSMVGSKKSLDSSETLYTYKTEKIGNEYYIKVYPPYFFYSGAYRIVFNASTTPPPVTLPTTNVTTLTANAWAHGNLTEGGEQWFKFTATATTQYLHFGAETLDSVNVQMYTNNGVTVGSRGWLTNWGNQLYIPRTVTTGVEYYIKVTPEASIDSGTYRITFNASTAPPPSVTLPTTGVTTLTVGVWANGTLTGNGEQWFKFTATAATQYIHFEPGVMDDVFVQLYNNSGSTVGSRKNLYDSTLSTSQTVTSGNEYYMKVTPYSGSYSGAYRIAFSTSATKP